MKSASEGEFVTGKKNGLLGNIILMKDDFPTATRGGIIYPSVDPSIFECKYPKRDVKVRILDL